MAIYFRHNHEAHDEFPGELVLASVTNLFLNQLTAGLGFRLEIKKDSINLSSSQKFRLNADLKCLQLVDLRF